MGYPSVFPTGTTIYDADRCWNGYTIYPAHDAGAVIIDMNGRVVRQFKGLEGVPHKLFPGGHVLGSTGIRDPQYGYQDMLDLIQIDWQGKTIWKFDRYEKVKDGRKKPRWMARAHHDYQRQGNPVGYYAPGMDPLVDSGNTLILCHKNLKDTRISDKLLLDDTLIEVTWEGEIVWEWICSHHFETMGFSEEARNIMARNPNMIPVAGGMGDWMHINSASTLGPNRWYDQGDERFHPDNIIWDGRQTNIIAITDKKSGKIVWQIGPDFLATPQLRKMRQIIGQHHAHMIPRGLPGEGNILVFDNGGWAGYGAPNPGSFRGLNNALRDFSRVLEFNPVTLEVTWKYTPVEAGFLMPMDAHRFYSGYISAAQRLPNGNTLITEGTDGRLIEVTAEHEIVWEYISPYFGKAGNHNGVYRAYRAPYEWIPQLDKPEEIPVQRPDNSTLRVAGVVLSGKGKPAGAKGRKKQPADEEQYCVIPEAVEN